MMLLGIKTREKLRNLINEETEYRRGIDLVVFFNDLGFNDEYGKGFPSRWYYTDEKLGMINGTDKVEQCIFNLFSPVNFIGRFNELDGFINVFNEYLAFDGYEVFRKGRSISIEKISGEEIFENNSVDNFLQKEFQEIEISDLKLSSKIIKIIQQRIEEIGLCLGSGASLSVVFLCGSTLEGILFDIAQKFPKDFNRSSVSPRDKEGKILPFSKWNLFDFINVSTELGFLHEDVKKYSHSLREFRNYIHPHKQFIEKFDPDRNTAKLSWQVLQAAIFQIKGKINNV